MRRLAGVLPVLLALLLAPRAQAQFWRQRDHGATPTGVTPLALEDVRVEEKLGASIPKDDPFTDWRGQPFTLARAFDGKKPVVLALVYYDCPMLCGLILTGLARA